MPQHVILTEEEVEKWRAEKAELEGTIVSAQQRLAKINKRLEAVALLLEGDEDQPEPKVQQPVVTETMMSAVPRILATNDPLTRTDLKQKLREAGFAEDRLGNYFYTVLARLKDRNRIKIEPDDRVTVTPEELFG